MVSDWMQTTLGAIATKDGYGLVDGPFGSNLPASSYTDNGVPVIRGSNLTRGTGRFVADEFVFVSRETANRLARSLCRPLDIVFTKKGTLGQTGLVPSKAGYQEYLLSSNQMKLTVDRHVADPLFVYYFVSSPESTAKIIRDSEATGVPKTNVAYLRDFPIALPPLPDQRAIAHILGTLDDKIELNRQMNETLEAMARALFKSWFVDFDPVRAKAEGRDPGLPQPLADLFPDSFEDSELGEIPRGWEVKELSDICEKPQYGYTASASDEPVGPRFLRITDINKRDWIEWDGVPFCSIDSEQRSRYTLAPGDIVIARMADPGHSALIEEEVDAVFASYLIRFRPQRHELARYVQYWLRSDSYWDTVRSMQSGTTRANLNATVLGSFGLLVPPNKVLRIFDQSARSFRDRIVANARESCLLAALRDALLPKLISGELRVEVAKRFVQQGLWCKEKIQC